ncbi:integrase, catalytic region, zinc finger, CCHC-type containing protein [Tanacetum coccineum]
MEVLIKTCLMPLAIKTQNDSFTFVHELKQEMQADLKYVESLENKIDELESNKAEFSNMYDTLLQECVSNDVMCSYLHSLFDLDAHSELQCLYLHKVKECECLTQKLSKQTKINKGKGVDTNFEGKPPLQPIKNQPVVRQPTAYKSERSQFLRHMIAFQVGVSHDLTKPITLYSWPQVRKSSFAKPYDVNAPGPSRNSPKHVSFQSPRESVGSNDMVHNYYLEEAKKKAQLQKDKALNTKPSVQQSARLPNTANGNKPKPRNFNQQPRNWPPSMSSCVSNRTVNTTEPPRNQKPFLKSKDLACPTCKKCIYSANHDECILKYLSKVHSRASAQKKDAQSHKTTKRYMPVEKKCDSKKHDRQIPIGQKFSPNKPSNVYLKTTPPRSGLTWKPTGRIFTQVGLKWIPIRKPVKTHYNTNDSASPLGKETHNPKTVICANSSSLNTAESDSLPHAHAQTTKTYYKYQDSSIKKAQVLKIKTSANSDIKDNSSDTKLRGGLLESFQDDAKKPRFEEDCWPQDNESNMKAWNLSETKLRGRISGLRFADKQSARPSRSLPSNTQPNPKGSSSKPYQPPQAQNEHVNAVFTLSGKPNYGKFLKELINNKHKLEQISYAFLSDESAAMIQNKVPPKLGDPRSFLILCNFSKAFSCNALADLGASINLMPYSLYAKLSLKTLRPTKMSVRLADRSFQHTIGITENMLVKVGKFTFHVDFVILEMEEDSKVPLILERPFLYTADAVI